MPKILNDEQIYLDVIKAVSEKGFSATTTKQMANSANISEVTLFRKFGSKLQLLKQAITYILEKVDFDNIVQYTGDIHSDLIKIVEASQVYTIKDKNFGFTLLLHVTRHAELMNSFDESNHIFLKVAKIIDQYQKEGVLEEEHSLQTVSSLLGPLLHDNIIRKALPKQKIPKIDPNNYITRFLTGRLVK